MPCARSSCRRGRRSSGRSRSGAGIAAISRFALELELEAGTLAVLDVPRWRVTRTISVVTARDVPLTPPAVRFLELLRAAFAGESEPPPNSNLPLRPLRSSVATASSSGSSTLLRGRSRLVTAPGPGGTRQDDAGARSRGQARGRLPRRRVPGRPHVAPRSDAGRAGDRPRARRPGRGVLQERLRGRRLLLLLDNFEQVASRRRGRRGSRSGRARSSPCS